MVERPDARRLRAVRAAPFATAVAAMIATPLRPQGGRARRRLSGVVVAGLATSTAQLASRRWGASRAAAALAGTATATWVVERIGSTTGVPFGRYRYTGVLRPQVAGVPAIVPLAWFAMALPAREVAHAALGRRSRPVTRVAAGAAALTAWDLFLDPQMVGEGFWVWSPAGRYRTVPMVNFAGWFVTSLGVVALLEAVLPPERDADRALVGTYSFMAVMEALGFAAFFRDRLVAAVGGAAMLPLAALAARRTFGRTFRRRDG